MTPLDIMINQANEKSTAVYEFCKSRASRMTLDALSLLSSDYDFGYDVEEKMFEISLKIPADELIKDRLDSLRCGDCPNYGKGESKHSLRTRCPHFSELMPPLNKRIRAYQLGKCLLNFERVEDEFQDLTARYIECPSSPSCSDDVECDYCKIKWLLEEGDLE